MSDKEQFESNFEVSPLPPVADKAIRVQSGQKNAQQDKISEGVAALYSGFNNDVAFGFLLAIAFSIGLTPLLPDNADLRYTIAWGALAIIGVLAWLLGNVEHIERETPENILWGIGFGILLGAPFLLFGGLALSRINRFMFPNMQPGTVLAYLLFVMPLSETLFFRNILQGRQTIWITGLLATLWNIVLFYPVMWQNVLQAPFVGLLILLSLLSMNIMYSYVRQRNSLTSAWLCQIVANILIIFVPLL